MNVICDHVPLEDVDLQLRTDRAARTVREPEANVAAQKLLPVLGDPYQVELDVEPGMGGPSVVFHPANVLEVVA